MPPTPKPPEIRPHGSTFSPEAAHSERFRSSSATEYGRQLLADCGCEDPVLPAISDVIPALEWAESGALSLTGSSEGPPEFAAAPLATAMRGIGHLLHAICPGVGFERLDAPALLSERAALAGLTRAGAISPGGAARILETKEGPLVANLPRPDDWRLVPAWLEIGGAPWEPGAWDRLARELVRHTSSDLVERARLLGLAIASASHPPPSPARTQSKGFRILHATEQAQAFDPARLRVLDLSTLWAGPLAGSVLARAGADVIKVESPERHDGARQGDPNFFDLMNQGKTSGALDLRSAGDRLRFETLLENADIVLESARPRALEQLGYDASAWVGERAGRIWLSITGYGRGQPERNWVAFGDDAAIAAGLGWSPIASSHQPGSSHPLEKPESVRDESPRFCADAIADPLTGLHAAAIALCLQHAGRGGLVDIALTGTCERILDFDAGPLTLPLERVDNEYGLVLDSQLHPIAPPRARALTPRSPKLENAQPGHEPTWRDPC